MDATSQQAFFSQFAQMATMMTQAMTALTQATQTAQATAQAAAAQAAGAAGPPPGGPAGHRGFDGEKKFSHGEQAWKLWAANFEVRLGTQSPKMRELLMVVEKEAAIRTVADVYATTPEDAEAMNLHKLAAELYEVLFLSTEGEAKLIVAVVPDRDGLVAWQRLYKHFNRRTLARVLREHQEAMHPRPQKDLTKLVSSIMEWEDKYRRMVLEENANGVPAL